MSTSSKLTLELDGADDGRARVLVRKTTAEALHTVARHLRLPIDEVLRLGLAGICAKEGWTIKFNGKARKR